MRAPCDSTVKVNSSRAENKVKLATINAPYLDLFRRVRVCVWVGCTSLSFCPSLFRT